MRGAEDVGAGAVCGGVGNVEERLEGCEEGEGGGGGGEVRGEEEEGEEGGWWHFWGMSFPEY